MDFWANPYRTLGPDEHARSEDALNVGPGTLPSHDVERAKTLFLAAKLITKQGEFVCVLRDVSNSGVLVRLFHKIPDEQQIALELPSGRHFEIRLLKIAGNEAEFQFVEEVDATTLIGEATDYPKRPLRVGVCFPIQIGVRDERWDGVVENISQQGARFECEGLFAIDRTVQLAGIEDAKGLISVAAKVRWRRDTCYGVVFDNTLSMGELAKLCVRLQSPMLAQNEQPYKATGRNS